MVQKDHYKGGGAGSSLNASSGGRGAGGGSGSNTIGVWSSSLASRSPSAPSQLFGQSTTIGAQLDQHSVQLFSQSSTRNPHRACINVDTGSRAQSGSVIRERRPCHQMDHAPQGVQGLLYVDFLSDAEAPGAGMCKRAFVLLRNRIFAPTDDMLP